MITIPHPPTTLSALLRLGLDDYYKIKATPGYVVDMGLFHVIDDRDAQCHVCLAGAVMAVTLRKGRDEGVIPEDCGVWQRPLDALDFLRQGDVRAASKELALEPPCEDADVPSHRKDPDGWEKAMESLYLDLLTAESKQVPV